MRRWYVDNFVIIFFFGEDLFGATDSSLFWMFGGGREAARFYCFSFSLSLWIFLNWTRVQLALIFNSCSATIIGQELLQKYVVVVFLYSSCVYCVHYNTNSWKNMSMLSHIPHLFYVNCLPNLGYQMLIPFF